MNKALYILLFSVLPFNAYTQETTTYYANGNIETVGNMVNGKKDGEWTLYDSESGNIIVKSVYVRGQEVISRSYFFDGKLRRLNEISDKEKKTRKEYFHNGNLRSVWIETLEGELLLKCYNNNGAIMYEQEVDEFQIKNGIYKNYYPSGALKEDQHFKDGKKYGNCKYYFENGKLGAEATFEDGNIVSAWKIYNANGELLDEKNITILNSGELQVVGVLDENGNNIGEWKSYYRDGNIRGIVQFDRKGERVSVSKYYPSGMLEEYQNYKDDAGMISEEFLENGALIKSVKRMPNDILILKEYTLGYDGKNYFHFLQEETTITYEAQKKEKIEVYKAYHQNGKLSGEGVLINGKMTGELKRFHENGELKYLGSYQKDQKVGEWKCYNEKGLLQTVEHYDNGKLHGLYQRYLSDVDPFHLDNMKIFYPYENYLIDQGYYKEGNKIGEWKSYDFITGECTETTKY